MTTAPPLHATGVSLKAHSRSVLAMRIVLPALIVGLIALLGLLIATHAVRVQAAAPRDTITQIRMVNPHFYGRDSRGRAFELTAAQAARSDRDMQEVLLDHVVVTLDVSGPHTSRVSADRGVYREDTRILRLNGNVHVDDGRASSLSTQQAIVDTRAGTVTGTQRVASRSTAGSISAQDYTVLEKGDRVIFRGGVRARINPR